MKRTQSINQVSGRSKIITALLSAMIALFVLVVSVFVIKPNTSANAETEGSITIHVYDSSNSYSSLAGWVWVESSAGKDYYFNPPKSDEPFYKDSNKAYTLEIPLSENHLNKLKGKFKLGLLVCSQKGTSGSFWDKYKKDTDTDVFVSLADAFDSNNHADIYYVRKDTAAYTNLEDGRQAMEKIISASFLSKTSSSVTVTFEASTSLTSSVKATLKEGKDNVVQGNVSITVDPSNKFIGKATFSTAQNPFSFSKEYKIELNTMPNKSCMVSKSGLIDTTDFITTYENKDTQDQQYGAIYSSASTTFRVWAPFATEVKLNIYDDGMNGEAKDTRKMTKRIPSGGSWGGVWEYTMQGDCKGLYYTYSVTNNGEELETIDPYAKACGANGLRGMVVDLKSTDPVGWDADKNWYTKNAVNYDTPIIWEVQVSDFSSSADSGMKYKGKYLAFTETGTTVPGKSNLKTGVDYLKELGVTYVHLNPVYDFATVDESDMTRADNGAFNWGYDPQNYNIPEGSYSTDPANGAVRINEFKRMVKALHDAGIGVVMDVVYNHTYSTSGQALHDTVPFYYHRTNDAGKFTDGSGCGNETASERTMMRKYIVESMLYWAEEYHIDGFRFDLMGIHDIDTIRTVRTTLDNKIGKRILIYGEPWSADENYVASSFTKRKAASQSGVTGYAINRSDNKMVKILFAGENKDYPRNMKGLPERVAVFNDTGREGLRGNNDPGQGWANGGSLGMASNVAKMMEGGAGDTGSGMTLGNGARNVAYACAHDNYTLWDQMVGKKHNAESPLFYDDPIPDYVKQCKLVAAAYMMSSGMCFMIAGEEMGRTKYGNENSYNSPVKLNQISWARQETFKDLHDFYAKLIGIRKQYSSQIFSYSKSVDPEFCYSNFNSYANGTIDCDRPLKNSLIKITLNGSNKSGSIKTSSGSTLLSF